MAPEDRDPPEDERVERASGDAGEDAASPSPRPELRAKDLVTRSREELEEALDPATMAELASWFTRPSMAVVRERQVSGDIERGGPAASPHEMDEFERLGAALGALSDVDVAVRERALAAIEPRMLDLFDRHNRAADTILPVRVEPKLIIDETLLPASVRALVPVEGEDPPVRDEPRLLEPSPDIAALLERDNAPQAVLRDLSRPVEEYELRLERAFTVAPEDDTTFAIRDALRWRPEPVPPIEPIPDVRVEWRPLMTGSWAEIVAAAKVVRQAHVAAHEAEMQADAEAGILWRF